MFVLCLALLLTMLNFKYHQIEKNIRKSLNCFLNLEWIRDLSLHMYLPLTLGSKKNTYFKKKKLELKSKFRNKMCLKFYIIFF